MKVEKISILDSVIIFASVVFMVLSFAGFYTETTVSSVIDRETGKLIRDSKIINNTVFSVVCSVVPLISTVVKKRWISLSSIVTEIINILYMTIIYPFLVILRCAIGWGESVSLTVVGWTGVCVAFLITALLIFREHRDKKIYRRLQEGSTKE